MRDAWWWFALSIISFLLPIAIVFCVMRGVGAGPNFEFWWSPIQLIRGSDMDISHAEALAFLILFVGPAVVGYASALFFRCCKLQAAVAIPLWFLMVPLISWGLGLISLEPYVDRSKMSDLLRPVQH